MYKSDGFQRLRTPIEQRIKASVDPFKVDLLSRSERTRKAFEGFMIKNHLIKHAIENERKECVKERYRTPVKRFVTLKPEEKKCNDIVGCGVINRNDINLRNLIKIRKIKNE
jgi:hypothetical protein